MAASADTIAMPADSAALAKLERWCGQVTRPIAFLGVIGMLVAAGITVIDVLMRWLLNQSVPGLNEIVQMIFCVAVTACLPNGLATGVNLKIDILAHWLTGRLAAWLDAAGAILLLILFALLAWRVGLYGKLVGGYGRTTMFLQMPIAPFLFGACALLVVGALTQAAVAANAVRKAIAGGQSFAGQKANPIVVAIVSLTGAALLALIAFGIVDFPALARFARAVPGWTIAIAFLLMWAALLLVVPLAAVMGLTGIAGTALFIGMGPSLVTFATEATGFLTNSQVATLPLFLMMGSFAAVAGMSDDLYKLAHALLGKFRGGLALATIGGCAGFGALTGSSLATAATIGRVAIPEMRSRGYSAALSTGCCAAGGTLGPLVPPGSGPIIVFALLTEASIGQLFVASVGPAILAVLLYFITIMIYVRVAPTSAPVREQVASSAELRQALIKSIPTWLVVGAVMGGLYLGLFTDTESAAVGAIGAFLCALLRGRLGRGAFVEVMGETTMTTALIYSLIFGAQIFSYFVGVSPLPDTIIATIGNLNWSHGAILALLLVFYLVLGSLMESFAVMVITVPIVTPLILNMGYDLVWWGIIMLCVVETGLIHPPLGLNVFVLKGIVPDIPMATIYKGVAAFVAADLVKLVLLAVFPAISIWLVSTMFH
jgi:C4-dicarboxylate transporter DctM subunit